MNNLASYLDEAGRGQLLTGEEEIALGKKIQAGDKVALNELVSRNLLLVASIAKKYAYNNEEMQDFIQEGNLGLITAAQKFDPSRGNRFSTYAVHWIRQKILRLMKYNRTVKIPENVVHMMHTRKKTVHILFQELGREPDDYEIADRMDVTVEKVRELEGLDVTLISLDKEVNDEDNFALIDTVRADCMIENDVDEVIIYAKIAEMVASLPEREKFVIERRMGLGMHRCHTLGEIGDIMSLSKERIRQIEVTGLKRFERMYGELEDG